MKSLHALVTAAALVLGLASSGFARDHFSAEQIFRFGDPTDTVPGAATLLRTSRGIEITASLTGAEAGGVYSVWYIIFNVPRQCDNPIDGFSDCSAGDFVVASVRPAVIWAAGAIADETGTVQFTGALERGTPPEGVFVNPNVGVGKLLRPKRAEIHLVFAPHGRADNLGDTVAEEMTSPSAGEFATIFNAP